MEKRRSRLRWAWCFVTVVLLVGSVSCGAGSALGQKALNAPFAQGRHIGEFPPIDEDAMTPGQRRFLTIVRAEHVAQRPGTTYSEGVDEPWCADFVTWVARESGAAFTNPHSRTWRIPGVWTLQEALQGTGQFKAAGSGYVPKLGDIALYDEGSPFGQHTNFVLAHHDGVLTTVGGNEMGAVRVSEHQTGPELKLLGYGAR